MSLPLVNGMWTREQVEEMAQARAAAWQVLPTLILLWLLHLVMASGSPHLCQLAGSMCQVVGLFKCSWTKVCCICACFPDVCI